jgi:hypothetical protein
MMSGNEQISDGDQISEAYSTRLAIDLLEAYVQPFKRVVEDVRIDHGECRRQLTIDWRLPSLREALPEIPFVADTRFSSSSIVVPLWPLRRDHMMSDFRVEGPDGERLYVCGQDESVDHTRLVLRTLWQLVEIEASRSSDARFALLAKAREDFCSLPELSAADATSRIPSIQECLTKSRAAVSPEVLTRVLLMARYVAKHHIIWMRLPCRPGDSVRLTVTYRTRFAADYAPRRGGSKGLGDYHFFRRSVDWARRITGQEPYRFAVPVQMISLCRSYHFQMPAPPAMYFVSQRFVLENNLHQSLELQQAAFVEHYKVNGAQVGGMDEAGGPVAHLYARDLPPKADSKLYAYARVRERPPGSTALVMWLATLTAGFLWLYFVIWRWLVASDTKGIDLASLSVALLGVASIWFSRAFREDVRTRVPLVSKLGLLLVGGSTLYSLVTILLQRVTCNATPHDGQVCATPLTNVFSRWGLFAVATLMTGAVIWLVIRRISYHREYRRLQVAAVARYMS